MTSLATTTTDGVKSNADLLQDCSEIAETFRVSRAHVADNDDHVATIDNVLVCMEAARKAIELDKMQDAFRFARDAYDSVRKAMRADLVTRLRKLTLYLKTKATVVVAEQQQERQSSTDGDALVASDLHGAGDSQTRAIDAKAEKRACKAEMRRRKAEKKKRKVEKEKRKAEKEKRKAEKTKQKKRKRAADADNEMEPPAVVNDDHEDHDDKKGEENENDNHDENESEETGSNGSARDEGTIETLANQAKLLSSRRSRAEADVLPTEALAFVFGSGDSDSDACPAGEHRRRQRDGNGDEQQLHGRGDENGEDGEEDDGQTATAGLKTSIEAVVKLATAIANEEGPSRLSSEFLRLLSVFDPSDELQLRKMDVKSAATVEMIVQLVHTLLRSRPVTDLYEQSTALQLQEALALARADTTVDFEASPRLEKRAKRVHKVTTAAAREMNVATMNVVSRIVGAQATMNNSQAQEALRSVSTLGFDQLARFVAEAHEQRTREAKRAAAATSHGDSGTKSGSVGGALMPTRNTNGLGLQLDTGGACGGGKPVLMINTARGTKYSGGVCPVSTREIEAAANATSVIFALSNQDVPLEAFGQRLASIPEITRAEFNRQLRPYDPSDELSALCCLGDACEGQTSLGRAPRMMCRAFEFPGEDNVARATATARRCLAAGDSLAIVAENELGTGEPGSGMARLEKLVQLLGQYESASGLVNKTIGAQIVRFMLSTRTCIRCHVRHVNQEYRQMYHHKRFAGDGDAPLNSFTVAIGAGGFQIAECISVADIGGRYGVVGLFPLHRQDMYETVEVRDAATNERRMMTALRSRLF